MLRFMTEKKKSPFKTMLQEFIYTLTYSRWVDVENRREAWDETVKRYCDFIKKKYGDKISDREIKDVYNAIYNLEVMPSMRALWCAGKAGELENLSLYNCAFTTIEKLKDFSAIMYILMCGTGVGFTVERKYVNNLPIIKDKNDSLSEVQVIFEDSKLGWVKGFEKVIECLWEGRAFTCDYSKIRPYGAKLKTFGGRASGPQPLIDLIIFTKDIVENNRGFQLRPVDVHDITCKIAEIVIVGGTRRSALISLSDLTDNELANAKMGEFWKCNPQRQLANNSVAYTRKPDIISYLDEWKNLYRSKSGERGIFSRMAGQKKANENGRRDGSKIIGINPCGEVLLRSKQTCNLTEVVIRPDDDFESLKRKIKIATLMGTWQAGFTDFKFIDKDWKNNCDEEALLGVSLTGLRDHKILGSVNDTAKKWLSDLKHIAIATNKKIAQKIGINQATAITVVKPSGTVSLLVDSSAGVHVRPTNTGYYIRRVRISSNDPMYELLKSQGFQMKPEIGQTEDLCTTWVTEFAEKAPVTAKLKGESALQQLEYWKMVRNFYTEHNPSATIYVNEDEWLEVATWVYKNFDDISGLTFLPNEDHIYQLAPFEDITVKEYEDMIKKQPIIDFSLLSQFEKEDTTKGSKELACTGDSCTII